MKRLLLAILAWARTEPARVHIYTALLPVVGLLVQRGYVTGSEVPFIEAILLGVLGIAGVETARARVVPVTKVIEAKKAAAELSSDAGPPADDVQGDGQQ